jgi:hypothetical protein
MNAIVRLAMPAALAVTSLVATAASADQPGNHPFFLHALSDLRDARAHLEKGSADAQTTWDKGRAVADIDAAIGRIKQAAIDDGKDLHDHPPVDAREPRVGRLHKALAALEAAHADVAREEDDAFAQGLKRRALADIDAATMRTREGLCNSGDTAFCPKK